MANGIRKYWLVGIVQFAGALGCASPDALPPRNPLVAADGRPASGSTSPSTNTTTATAPQTISQEPTTDNSSTNQSQVQQVRHEEKQASPAAAQSTTTASTPVPQDQPELAPPPQPLTAPEMAPQPLLIHLPAALKLAGANNWQIALATERIQEAQARLEAAQVLWLPSLDAGVGYNRHDGQIQDTAGFVIDDRRSSLFVGGGARTGIDAVNGGTNGPARLAIGVSLTDAIFAPLAARQLVRAANANRAATFNDTLMQVAVVYFDLVRAQGQVAIAREAEKNAGELVRLVEARVRAGTAPPADEFRARAERSDRQRQVFEAEEAVQVVSAELVRLLRLDPATTLLPAETQPAPIVLVEAAIPLPELLALGLTRRPEMAAHQALVQATLERLRQEHWRPFLPNLAVGYSAGGFGGGRGTFFGDFRDRNDFDALAVWELRNLGFGNRALRRERFSQNIQAGMTFEQMRDTIAAEVVRAYYQVLYRGQQIEAATAQVQAAAEALPLNFKGILGGQLRAIEAQQAVQALAAAQYEYLAALVEYNQAQVQLVRALGQPPAQPIANCNLP